MENINSRVFLFCMLTLFICGACLFLVGFFPDAYSGMETSEETENSRPTNVNGFRITPAQRRYDQIILMIIDALRFDFLTMNENMPFTHSKRCNLLKLHVAIPTVTMPRIKSLMTGKLSNFIDIIRNLGEAEQLSDSLIHVLKRRGDMINFAGDRTWTQLFPNEFTRARPNFDSFFVRDFYEGDKLVKKTLSHEISKTDWSLLILHLLGLDHIGHVEGSNSTKIPDKLLEMDGVIRYICENSHFEKRLLLVTGDHGMRNGGGHGGSTAEEIKVPLVFFAENCKQNVSPKKEYNQIDMTPTLAILFSVEIPKPSIGCLISELLVSLTFEEKLYAYFYNAQHLLNKATAKYGKNDVAQAGYSTWYKTATKSHRHFLEAKTKNLSAVFHYEQAVANYKRLAENISTRIAASLVSFDNVFIIAGIFLTTTVTIYTIIFLCVKPWFIQKRQMLNKKRILLSITISITTIGISYYGDLITMITSVRIIPIIIFTTVAIYIALGILRVLLEILLPLRDTSMLHPIECFPIPSTLGHVLSVALLASSSYVECEQLSSYYLGSSCLLFLIIQILFQRITQELVLNKFSYLFVMRNLIATFPFLIILRFFYSTKIKHELNVNKVLLESLFPLGLLLLIFQLKRLTTTKQMVCSIFATIFVFCFRAVEGELRYMKNIEFSPTVVLVLFCACVLIISLLEFRSFWKLNGHVQLLKTFITNLLLIASLLHKPQNVILVPCLLIILDQIYRFCDNLKIEIFKPHKHDYILAHKTLMTILIANMFFFYQGNSNSLATIDLSPGYIGQTSYNPVIVAILLTINTYSSPIIAFYFLMFHVLEKESESEISINRSTKSTSEETFQCVLTLYTTATLVPAAIYLGFMILFRYHLFIYSVFAPKFFYECYNVIVLFINYCVIHLFIFFKK